MIGADAFGLIELLGVFGLILGVLGWQWVSIRRTLREDKRAASAARTRKTEDPGAPPP